MRKLAVIIIAFISYSFLSKAYAATDFTCVETKYSKLNGKINRCENDEAICYIFTSYNNSIWSCDFKVVVE